MAETTSRIIGPRDRLFLAAAGALLLLTEGLCPFVRASSSDVNPIPAVDEKDGGKLTKEERRKRREERRRLRRERRNGRESSYGTSEEAEAEEEERQQAMEERGAKAFDRAMRAGDALKKSFQQGGGFDLPEGAGDAGRLSEQAGREDEGSPGSAGAPSGPAANGGGVSASSGKFAPSALRTAGSGDPSRPVTPAELVLAVQSGYGGSLEVVGLKLTQDAGGTPSFLRKDGTPATSEDLETLRRHMESEPAALMRRPDFFQILPRQRFSDLKKDFRGRQELHQTSFRDVGMTEADRDFIWSRSCDRLSGGCNPAAYEGGYKKNADVAPEDLDNIWNDIYGTADTFIEAVTGKATASDRIASEQVDRSAVKNRLTRLGSAIRGWTGAGESGTGAAGVLPQADMAGPAGTKDATAVSGAPGPGGSAVARERTPEKRTGRAVLAALALAGVLIVIGVVLLRREKA